MTRINCIDPAELADQHLMAEYRELPRVWALAKQDPSIPSTYRMGAGHVRFFYTRLGYLRDRHVAIVAELMDRGYRLSRVNPLPEVPGLMGSWEPGPKDRAVNLARLREKLVARPGFYRYRGAPCPPDFY